MRKLAALGVAVATSGGVLAASTTTATGETTTAAAAPATPPAQICGNAAILNGPSSPPAGAVTVQPGQNLGSLTQTYPPGTTFWLAPGTHTLSSDPYDQVIPKDNNSYIGAPGSVFDGRGVNYFAFTQPARAVTIKHMTIRGFAAPNNQGAVNHDSGNDWVLERNTIANNKGAALMAGARNRIAYNCLADNGQYGLNAYQAGNGVVGLVVDHNEIKGNNTENWEVLIPGCGCTGGMKFWATTGTVFTNNWVHDNKSVGVWVDGDNANFLIENNWIEGNDSEGIWYEISYNAIIRNNVLRRNALVKGKTFAARGDRFPVAALYISEAGGDSRVVGPPVIDVYGNDFQDNWSGVALWENADRFCGNGELSTMCTLVNPTASTATSCKDPATGGLINTAPYYSDCRWKTQNVKVHDNTFSVNKSTIGCVNTLCARNAIFSNYGTWPSWSPYKGTVIQQAITFEQGNRFSNNVYVGGPWRFTAFDTARDLSFSEWQAAPYGQDLGSVLSESGTPTTTTTAPTTTSTTAAPTPTTTTTLPTPAPTLPVVTDTTAPSVPANLVLQAAGKRFASLAWSPSTDVGGSGLGGYAVYRAQNNGSYVQIARVTSTRFDDSSVKPKATYSYYVRAYDQAGNTSEGSAVVMRVA